MTKTILKILAVAMLLSPVGVWVVRAQSKQLTATYISREEVEAVGNSEQDKTAQDLNLKIVDIGNEHMTVGILHRASTRNPPANAVSPGRGNAGANAGGNTGGNAGANAATTPPVPCGRHFDTLPPGGHTGGYTHDSQTEGYYIISGGGTMFTDGYMANGHRGIIVPNGWSCQGATAYDVKEVVVKTGDIIIIPPGVVHGWSDIPDHVDYLSFRPSQNELQVGWVNPIIANMKP
jgi:hypothetical protein